MIRVERADEPDDFDRTVRQPGALALRELAGDADVPARRGPKRKKMPALWTAALPDMRLAYHRVCAYLALYVHRHARDTVDHFIPRDTAPHLAFEWDNLRYALFDINRAKGTREVLDPFAVESDWFDLNLATFEVGARRAIGDHERTRWDNTLAILNQPVFCDAREWYHERYFGRRLDDFDPDEPMSLAVLRAQAPFVARELERRGRLRPEDMKPTR